MKRFLTIAVVVVMSVLMTGCYNDGNGELVGVLGRQAWYYETPLGMVYIPAGSYNMGASDQDVPYAHTNRSKTVSIQAFFMDDTEISNNEYRQFVHYVKDSIARTLLAEVDEYYMITEDEFGNAIEPPKIDWNYGKGVPYHGNEEEMEALEEMYYDEGERFYGRREIDTRKLIYDYYWLDLKSASSRNGQDLDLSYTNVLGHNNAIKGHVDRSKFIIHETIQVYPDTLTWIRDFTYAYHDPMAKMYFWHPAYDDYPVVGITWKQAKAFCIWRTNLLNNWREFHGFTAVQDFRLPTEAEWEYAARGGRDLSMFPWGNPYLRNSRGCFLGNFKPMRGRYFEDGGFHTVKITSYHPNDYGLFCMAGNVAEWTSTAFDESVYEFSHDMNPEYVYEAFRTDPPALKRKVIRGGSWKDIGYYLQTGTRTYEYQDTAKCYIGFRCVMTYLGRQRDEAGLGISTGQ